MVVKATPPENATWSSSRRCARRFGTHRLLPQQFVATLELSEKLVVQVVAVGQGDDRRVVYWVGERK